MAIKADIIESRDLIRGEVRQKGIIITRSDGETLTLTSAKYCIYKTGNIQITNEMDAIIENNGTTAVRVYANVVAGNETGGRYIEFTYTIGSWIGKTRLVYNVV